MSLATLDHVWVTLVPFAVHLSALAALNQTFVPWIWFVSGPRAWIVERGNSIERQALQQLGQVGGHHGASGQGGGASGV